MGNTKHVFFSGPVRPPHERPAHWKTRHGFDDSFAREVRTPEWTFEIMSSRADRLGAENYYEDRCIGAIESIAIDSPIPAIVERLPTVKIVMHDQDLPVVTMLEYEKGVLVWARVYELSEESRAAHLTGPGEQARCCVCDNEPEWNTFVPCRCSCHGERP